MIRTILVDDEPPARQLLREYLADYPAVQVVAECGNGRDAVAAINAERPDLVFLDIQMPGLTGFDVLEQLTHMPHLIFATAYDAFALQAFETGAVDYLLKPYARSRFSKAMDRFLAQHQRATPDVSQLAALLQAAQPTASYADRLFVKVPDRIVPVPTAALRWVEAAGDYTQLHTAEATYLCSLGIGALAERLDPAAFVRIHRSSLIALAALRHLASDGEGGYIATLDDGYQLRVSRSYAPAVRALIV